MVTSWDREETGIRGREGGQMGWIVGLTQWLLAHAVGWMVWPLCPSVASSNI